MIRYAISLRDLRARIKAIKPTWFCALNGATASLPARPQSSDFQALWNEVKDVYIELQHFEMRVLRKTT